MCDPIIKTVDRMISVGTPIIVLDSHDHPHATKRLVDQLNTRERPVVLWNVVDGYAPGNALGEAVIARLDPKEIAAVQNAGPHAALAVSLKFPASTALIMDNLHWFYDKPVVQQALLNLREPYKGSKRVCIALTLGAKIPTDLIQSASYVEDPLPDEVTLAQKVQAIHKSALGGDGLPTEEANIIAQELRGTSPFRAEQLAAQSLSKDGIDRSRLRDNARKQINDTPGLSVETCKETFSDIGGLDAICKYLKRYFNGPRRPTVVVRIEELEKAMAGTGTETSGTSSDALGTLLTEMEDNGWNGIFAHGISGNGKSLIAKACANEFGCKAIRFDINACKGSLVGESEKQIRQAMAVLKAIGGDRVFFVASMNKSTNIPPELARRFAAGTWYFDIPTDEARKEIWKISAARVGVAWDGYDAPDLTGSDIRDIVQRSYELSCTTTEAAQYHVPLCRRSPDAITQSRGDAIGRYLDANYGGTYGTNKTAASSNYDRKIDLT